MGEYIQTAIRQLKDWQVRAATPQKRIEQTVRAERLLEEIDPTESYPYDYLWYRITGYRPDHDSQVLLPGQDLTHDLRLYVEDLSDSVNMPAEEADEPVLTVEDLRRRFNISAKTISRWRQRGLVGRRFLFDGRKRMGFLQSSVDRFVGRHADQVRRSIQFRQLSGAEKEQIIRRARRLAAAGASLTEASRRIARKLNRSIETVRYTLKRFDRENPEQMIFPRNQGALSEQTKQTVYRQHQNGASVQELARRYGRTRTTIYRVVNEMRARRLLEHPIDFMYHLSFDQPEAEEEILGPYPERTDPAPVSRVPAGLPPYLESLYDVPLLTREQERYLFRKMNYFKYRADRLRDQLNPRQASTRLMDEIEELLREAQEVKNQIVRANLRLVVSIAKRHVGPGRNFFELVSDGNLSLIRAVEKFDFSRGNKFSTYASWAIMKNFARSIPEESHHQDRFRTGEDILVGIAADNRANQWEQESSLQGIRRTVGRILDHLNPRERQIIIKRFGLDEESEPQTLEEVGHGIGVTKERVRQLEARALDKLRKYVHEQKMELPEL